MSEYYARVFKMRANRVIIAQLEEGKIRKTNN